MRTDANEQKITKFFAIPTSINKSFDAKNISFSDDEKPSEESMIRHEKFENMLNITNKDNKEVHCDDAPVNKNVLERIAR